MTISTAYPDLLQNGSPADATQVMADFYQIQNDVNANAAHNGANNDITSLTGLTTPLGVPYGGIGTTSLTQYGVVLGQGASALTVASPAAQSTVLMSNGPTANPSFQAILQVIVGEIKMWGASSPPAGYFECNGAAVSRATYAALFAIIGTTYGNGDGSTTFNLPDFRGYFPRGWDDSAGRDPGRSIGSTQSSLLGSHNHTASVSDPGHTHTFQYSSGGSGNAVAVGGAAPGGSVETTNVGTTNVSVGIGFTGGSETRPINLAVMFIIKY